MLPLVGRVLELFGPFDVKISLDDERADWQGAYTADYVVPEALRAGLSRATQQGVAKRSNQQAVLLPADEGDEVASDRRERFTAALAFLHSRGLYAARTLHAVLTVCLGVDALLNFNIEGDAGGEDPQLQSLWLYQTSGGLPSKVSFVRMLLARAH